MNKTHGLVASAWMLGSGLLLNVSLTAQAQDSSTASEEYFSPQRSTVAPTRKAPGLLPSIIRNADTSKEGSVVRPIGPATNSLNAGRKINSAVPMATRSSNRSAVVPAALKQNSVAIQSANEQSDAAPSPIQKQLEELYRKDGRPMPQMNFSQTPVPANDQVPAADGSVRPNMIAPSNVVPPKPRTFLDKINPFSRNKSAPAALPQHGNCVGTVFDTTFFAGLNEPKWADYAMVLPSIDPEPWGLGVRKEDTKFTAFISDVTKEWHKTGFIIELEKKWGIPQSPFLLEQQAKYK